MRQNELMKMLEQPGGPRTMSVSNYNRPMALRLQKKGLVEVEIVPQISETVDKNGRKRYFTRKVAVVSLRSRDRLN